MFKKLLSTLLLCAITSTLQPQNKSMTVAVIDFQNKGNVSKDESSILTNRFRGLLVETGAFTVVEREKMLDILKEQDFTLTDDCNSAECAVQVGQLLGVESIIAGDIGKLDETFTVDVRMIDVTTGKILKTLSRDYSGKIDGLLTSMNTIVSELSGYVSGKEKQTKILPVTYTEFLGSIEMVFVTGDTFMMGHDQGESGEKPAHWVFVDDFYIGRYELTQRQWSEVMNKRHVTYNGCDSCPVDNLSWNDAQYFIKILNQRTGKNYRLPYEAEWEYAAKGGRNGSQDLYSGGDKIDELGWYVKNSGSKIHPVGLKKPNALGIHDMSGNAAEWCQDWYSEDYYKTSPLRNPSGPKSAFSLTRKVLRGGAWNDDKDKCRTISRKKNIPDKSYDGYGFRIVHPALGLDTVK